MSAAPSLPIRVASFNIRTSSAPDGDDAWSRRRAACVGVIQSMGCDVVGLQEVRPDQLADLRSAFPDARFVGAARDVAGTDEHATVMIDAAWTIESVRTRWLSDTPDRPGSIGWDADLPRVATLVHLRGDGVRLGVVNTHLDHIGVEARQRGAELIVAWVQGEADRPWIVTGDLNTTPRSEPVSAFAAAGLLDSLPPDAPGTEHAFTGAVDRTRIDYVLAGPGVSVRSARVVVERPDGRLPSDHWPVVADLRLG